MRIIIETDDRSNPQLELRSPAGSTADVSQPEATDGGPPSAELLNALSPEEPQVQEPEPRGASRKSASTSGEDGGGAPSWLTAIIEGGEVRRP